MQVDDTLLDALEGLFGGKIYKHKTKFSKELSFEKYANKSLSAGILNIYSNTKINGHNNINIKNHSIYNEYNDIFKYQKQESHNKCLFVKSLTGKSIVIPYNYNDTILKIKTKVLEKEGYPIGEQRLIFNGKQLKNDKNVLYYNITCDSTLDLLLNLKGGGWTEYHLPDDLFDPKFDFDFTNVKDTGKKFMRGGLEYKRPCGWKRYALKVDNKYENTKWLGSNGYSNNNTEWAVSYHGTKIYCAEPIIKEGLKPGNRNSYGIGIYCTPNIYTAEKYAEIFTNPNTNRRYKIVFQNRVKPSSIIECKLKGGPDDYWYIENTEDIRPYSICIKEIN